MEAVLVAKFISLVIVLVISVLFGNMPYFVLKRRQTAAGARKRSLIISIFNAFSGGVFLGTCLLHLMVEGREELGDAISHYDIKIEYPLFEVLVAVGFFAIVIVDFAAQLCFHESTSIVLEANKPKQPPASYNEQGGSTNPVFANQEFANPDNLQRYGSITDQHKRPLHRKNNNDIHSVTDTLNDNLPAQVSPLRSPYITVPDGALFPETSIDQTENNNLDLNDSNDTREHHQHHSGHDHTRDFDQLAKASTVRAVLLLIALSFHTIFDGLAIGLQEFDSDVWQVLAAIGVHKALVAFCLGLQLYQAYKQRTKTAIILVQLFCLMSPIGIGMGIIVTSGNVNAAAQSMTSAILQGFASGTFIYVTFFEILKDAFTHGQSIWNIVVAAVGFGAMAAVKLLDSD